jgi:hypothetical protein
MSMQVSVNNSSDRIIVHHECIPFDIHMFFLPKGYFMYQIVKIFPSIYLTLIPKVWNEIKSLLQDDIDGFFLT